jgi:hypothetical protein
MAAQMTVTTFSIVVFDPIVGLALLGEGRSAEQALTLLLARDADPDRRQVGRAGHYHGDIKESWDAGVRQARDLFSGTENLEERFDLTARTVAPLAHLRRLYGA